MGVNSAPSAGMVVLGVPFLQPLAPAPALVLADTLTGVDLGGCSDFLPTGTRPPVLGNQVAE